MSRYGPIILVDDDRDEWLLFKTALNDLKLNNPIYFFRNGFEALEYLEKSSENPFLILCDLNMPIMDGFSLRERICNNPTLQKKSIPFIFHSSSATQEEVEKAYLLTVQGFFTKKNGFEEIKKQLKFIVDYWLACEEPNSTK
jgi:CheY-like chemotaxis protein